MSFDGLPTRIEATYRITQDLVDAYAEVSGDRNPLHIDPAYAAGTRFGRTVAHGLMSLGALFDTIEARLPEALTGRAQVDCVFVAPVFPGDLLRVEAELGDVNDTSRTYACLCKVGDRVVLKAACRFEEKDKV